MNADHRWYVVILLLFISAMTVHGQQVTEPENAGRIDKGRIILQVDPNWTDEEKSRFAVLFELDSLISKAIFANDIDYINDTTEWTATVNINGITEISKTIGLDVAEDLGKIILSELIGQQSSPQSYSIPANFGVNDFSSTEAFSYHQGIACFKLPGYKKASNIILSGSFNQWSTMQLPMAQTDSGWELCIELPPGKYHYKYISDGRWMTDPNNRLRERDGQRGYNSVIYAYNHVFRLNGHQEARRVVVTGSFSDWHTRKLPMHKTPTGWELPVYLGEGTHAYKFIVDGNWINDPDNPVTRHDDAGNLNSFLGIGDSLIFRLQAYSNASKVILTGSFNGWDTGELPMEKTDQGWELPYVLGAGNHEYKFIVDGQWITDPDNPYTIGSGDYTNSVLPYKYNHVFTLLGYGPDHEVFVTGSFTNWNPDGYRMTYDGGVWLFPAYLPPGRHAYKYIVDGEWIIDPDNPLWEDNRYGTGNSVLWME